MCGVRGAGLDVQFERLNVRRCKRLQAFVLSISLNSPAISVCLLPSALNTSL